MKCLVDTCGWIEWLTDGRLADDFRPWLEAGDALVVPTSIQFELYKWGNLEKLSLPTCGEGWGGDEQR